MFSPLADITVWLINGGGREGMVYDAEFEDSKLRRLVYDLLIIYVTNPE